MPAVAASPSSRRHVGAAVATLVGASLLAVGESSAGAVGPSSPSLPVGDLPGWRQTFVEDFTTDAPLGSFEDAYEGRWATYEGARDTSGAGLYAESRVLSVQDGLLDAHLRTEDGQALVAAPVPLVDGSWGGQLHGRYSVRFRADPVPGYKTAWLLWPDSERWVDGEVDFPEGPLTGTISAFDHCVGAPTKNCFTRDTGVTYGDWHTATIEWTPGRVAFVLDGRLVGTSPQAPSTPMHWVLQTETDHGPPPAAAQGHVQVDWVAVYEPA